MKTKSILSSIGIYALGLIGLAVAVMIATLFIVGAELACSTILPWLMRLCVWAFAFNIVILTPLALIPPTRRWAGLGFFISSYVFGLTGWSMGLLLTLDLWGVFAVVIGLFLLGIGVVPIAMLATLFNGMWIELGLLVLAVVLTYGLRTLALFIEEG